MKKIILLSTIFLLGNISILQAQNIDTLLNQVRNLFDAGKYSETLDLLKSNEKAFQKAKPEKQAAYLDLTGQTYIKLSKFPEAEESLLKAQSVLKNKKSADYANALSSLGVLYRNTGNYEKSESFYLEALPIQEKFLGKEHPEYANTLNNLGIVYYNMGNYAQTEKYFLEAKNIREKVLGQEHPDYTMSLNNLGNLYSEMGDFSKAEIYYLEAKTIREKVLGREHPNYAISLNNLASLYYKFGNYADAEKNWLEAKTIFEKVFGKEHPNYANSLNNLGVLYRNMGNNYEAEKYYLETKKIIEKALGKEHQNYAASLNNLGFLYNNSGNFSEAEKYYMEAKTIFEKVLGKEHPNYASSLNNLGVLYQRFGNYIDAEIYFLEAKSIYEKIFGKDHINYANSLNNLGFLYSNTGNYTEAEKYFLEAKIIREKILGIEHSNYASSLNHLGLLYSKTGNYAEAEKYFLEAKTIREKIYGKKHSYYATSLIDLGGLYKAINNYAEAEKYFLEAKTIYENVYGKENPDYVLALNSLAILYLLTGDYPQAQSMKSEADKLLTTQVETNFSFLSERQRSLFWDKNKQNFEAGFSFVSANPVSEMTSYAYNNVLFTKGLLLRTVNGIKDAIYSSGDDELIAKYDYLKSLQQTISALQLREPPDLQLIETLKTRADSLDKTLTVTSIAYKNFNEDVTLKWQNIQDVLKPNEAAIEFIHFRPYDGKRWSDTIIYVALLLKKDIEAPLWIPLFEEKVMNDLTRSSTYSPQKYAQSLFTGTKGDSLYNLIWQPIEKELQNIKTIYYSPSGILHQVSFAAIPAGGSPLKDKYNLQLVSGTREIERLKVVIAGDLPQGSAVIYGGLWYDVNKDRMISEAQLPPPIYEGAGGKSELLGLVNKSSSLRGGTQFRFVREGVPWSFLPGTKKEAEQISKCLEDRQYQYKMFQTSSGNEESFKQLSGTNTGIIHLATHGFFLDNIDYEYDRDIGLTTRDGLGKSHEIENPMLRSGLLLSGSNRAWTGEDVIEGIEDGILTAEEISYLNMSKTQLVVLSACKTGLGEATTYEGVFGLQRAFKLAGVESIIMSLWSVPDNATAELMISFYQSWLSGKNKHDAFREAQQKVREKYPEPYFWAGFVMMD